MSVIAFFGPALVILSCILIVAIYRIIYKQNMNRALEGRATTGLIDLGSLIKAITFIALIVMNIMTLSKIEDLSWRLQNVESSLSNQINNIKYSIGNMESTMDEYYQSLELVQSHSQELTKVNLSNDTYTYDVSFTLLEKEVDSDVYLIVEHEGTTQKELLTSSTLTFNAEIDLEYSTDEYDINVLIEGSKLLQEDISTIRVDRDAEYIIGYSVGFLEGPDGFILYPYVAKDIELVDGVDVQSVEFKVFSEGELHKAKTIDTTTSLKSLLSGYTGYDHYMKEHIDDNTPVFTLLYETDFFTEVTIEYTITLTDGTVLERTIEGF